MGRQGRKCPLFSESDRTVVVNIYEDSSTFKFKMRTSIAPFKNNGKLCSLRPFVLNIKLYKVTVNLSVPQLKTRESVVL
jgi:hypothetical protein